MELESNDNLADKLIGKSIGQYIFFLLIVPSGYIIKLLLTNALSVSDFGLLYAIVNLIGLISIYNDLGLTECLQYFIPQYIVKKDRQRIFSLVNFTFLTQLVTGVIIIGWLYRWADRIAAHYFHTETAAWLIRIFCRYFGFLNILQVCSSLFVAYQKPLYQNITEVVRMWSIVSFILIMARVDVVDVTAASYAWIVGAGVGMLISLFITIRKYKHILVWQSLVVKSDDVKVWLRYAVWVFIGANVGTLFGQIDQLIIVGLWGTEQAGFYSAYQSLIGIYGSLMSPFAVLLYPLMTQMIAEKDDDKLLSLLWLLYKCFFVCAIIFAIVFGIYGRDIAIILFGEKFAYSGELTQRWWILHLLGGINWITFTLYAARGAVKERVGIIAEWLVINIAMIWWWYHRRGLYGCIAGFGIAMLYIALRTQWILHHKWHFHDLFDRWFMVKNITAGIVVAWLLRLFNNFIPLPIHRVWWALMIGLMGLIVSLLIAGVNWSYMQVMWGLVRGKLRKK